MFPNEPSISFTEVKKQHHRRVSFLPFNINIICPISLVTFKISFHSYLSWRKVGSQFPRPDQMMFRVQEREGQ